MRPVSYKQDCQIGPAVSEEDQAAEAASEEADFCGDCDCQNCPTANAHVIEVEPEAQQRETQDDRQQQQEEGEQREGTSSVS